MKYFKQNNEVYAYDDEQISQGYGKDMTPMTDEEVELHINPPKTAEQIEAEAKAEAKAEALAYLDSTDWITAKYNDVVTVLGTSSKADFVAKYREIYDNRTAARAVVGVE